MKRRPAASKKAPKKKVAQSVNAKKKQAQKEKAAVPKQPAQQSKDKENAEHKSTFRHRKTSAAYHSARKAAEAEGKSLEEAKDIGRAASRKMGADIDAGLVKEP